MTKEQAMRRLGKIIKQATGMQGATYNEIFDKVNGELAKCDDDLVAIAGGMTIEINHDKRTLLFIVGGRTLH